jgi:hypothetical protein
MCVSKVQLANGEVLVDLTEDSVTEETLAEGATAHDASGKKIIGTMKSGGASVQSDWNQTDETAADFIKNKPFGDIKNVLVNEQTVNVVGSETYISTNAAPSIGSNVIVTFNGEHYSCTAGDFYGYAFVGNGSLYGLDDTGEPFLLIWMDNTNANIVIDGDVSAEITIAVTGVGTVPVPEKYLSFVRFLYMNTDSMGVTRLYTDAATTTVITRFELLNIMESYLVWILTAEYERCSITSFRPIELYATAEVILGNGERKTAYTAEYTG